MNVKDFAEENDRLCTLLSSDIHINTNLLLPMPFLNHENKALVDFLKKFYKGNNRNKIIASLINSIFTTNSSVFILTRKIYETIIIEDMNHDLKSLNTQTYKNILISLYEYNIIERLKKPLRSIAGLYKLSNPYLLDIFKEINADMDLETEELNAIERYDRVTKAKYPNVRLDNE